MRRRFYKYLKMKSYTLRFSILSIFLILLIISMTILITVMYVRATHNITYFALNLMKQISSHAFLNIGNELEKVQIKNISAAKVIKSGVINLNFIENDELLKYTRHILQNEGGLFHLLQSVQWNDPHDNTLLSEKMPDGTIRSEVIYTSGNKRIYQYVYYDEKSDTFKKVNANKTDYLPTQRFWYLEAIKNKKTIWVDVYKYKLSDYLGISVLTPIYSKENQLLGVIRFDVRLDFLRKEIESIKFSEHGVVFLVTKEGRLISFPHLIQYTKENVMGIDQLTNYPWVVAAYHYHIDTKKEDLIFDYDNKGYIASFTPLKKIGDSEWLIGAVAPKNDFILELLKTTQYSIAIGILILLISIFIVSSIISRVVRPMRKITEEIDKIKNFDLVETPKIQSRIKEISYMAEALYAMKQGLRSFQKYVPSSLVRDLVEAGEEVKIGSVKKPLAIMFTDIYNFTSIAEISDPDTLALQICDYFDALSTIIIKHHGTIDKYIGDSIMAFWGAPLEVEHSCYNAAKTALLCIKQSNKMNNHWELENKPAFYTSIGLHFGEAIVGNFGSSERLSYTAFGDAVNLASRLQNVNRYFDTNIIVSESVYQAIKDKFVLRMIDCVTVKGKKEAVNIYELIGENTQEVKYDIDRYRTTFAYGYQAYKNQEWNKAIGYFKKCLEIYKDDAVSFLFLTRCEKYIQEPPPLGWAGIWNLDKKPI